MNTHHTKLPNGVQLVLAPLHDTKAATILILYRIGSRYETASLNGCAHFIEHLMFKGTKKRPSTLLISKELDGVGAEFNAFTSKDHTGYYIKLAADKLPMAVDILEDMLYHSFFLEKEINRERGVVIEEINMYEDNPIMQIDDLFEQDLYGKNDQLGRSIAGPREVIRDVTRDKLLAFRDQYYLPSNMLVAVSGKFEVERLTKLLTKAFGRVTSRRSAPIFKPWKLGPRALRVRTKYKPTEQTQMMLGVPSFGMGHKDMPALNVLSLILGGTMSSRLFITIRERLGLCYSIRSGVTVYQDVGNLAIQAGLDKTRLQPALSAIVKELRRMCTTRVSREELTRAKEYFRGKLVLNLEDSEHIANWLGKQQLLSGKMETPEQKLAKVLQVTTTDILRVAKRVIRLNALTLTIIGAEKNTPAVKRMLEQAVAAATGRKLRG